MNGRTVWGKRADVTGCTMQERLADCGSRVIILHELRAGGMARIGWQPCKGWAVQAVFRKSGRMCKRGILEAWWL